MKFFDAIFTAAARVLLTLALGFVCLPGCRKASTLEPAPDAQEATVVTLRITAGEAPATRVDSESADAGESFENYIDIAQTHILFFIDDKFSEEFIPETIAPVGSAKYPVEWSLSGPIENVPEGAFKVVILANCTLPTLTAGSSTIEDLCKAAVYSAYSEGAASAFQPSASNVIPMYGVRSYDLGLKFRRDIETDLGQIYLLRAMAKVIIRNTSGKALTSAAVNGVNYSGAAAPLGLYSNTSEWEHANTYDKLADCLAVHLPGESTLNETSSTTRSVALIETQKSATEEVWTGYFPEYLNVKNGSEDEKRPDCSYITLAFEGISQTYNVDFRYYSTPTAEDDNTRFDIKRNHIYEFNVTSVDSYRMNLILEVQPWTVKEFSYSYSDNVTAKDSGAQKWTWASDGSTVPVNSDNKNKMTFSSAGSINVTFTIDTPLGADWVAVFEQKSGDLNHFSFSETGTDRISGVVKGEPVTLTIDQNPETNGMATLVIYAYYGNVSFKASTVLGGEYVLEKY